MNIKFPEKISHIFKSIKPSNALALIAAFISLFTLLEMKAERNAAYKPSVLLNPSECSVSWTADGENAWVDSIIPTNSPDPEFEIGENGTITGTVNIDQVLYFGTGIDEIIMINIGVGPAKDIVISWAPNNITQLYNYLIQENPSDREFAHFGKSCSFNFDKGIVVTDPPLNYAMMYMLPEGQESYPIKLPIAYTILIQRILEIRDIPQDTFPVLKVNISYEDIQGRHFSDDVMLFIKKGMLRENPDSTYSLTYQLVPMNATSS